MARKPAPRVDIPTIVPADLPPIGLPRPRLRGSVPIEACLQLRRSTRHFSQGIVSLSEISQLLWAGQGVTGLGGLRTAPSAGALYPIRTYLFAGRVRGLPMGIYRYYADDHYIRLLLSRDVRPALIADGLDRAVSEAPALIVLASDYRMPAREFGENARRLVHIEAGHIGQNVCLEATALGIGAIGLGVYPMESVRRHLGIKEHEEPVYILAVGKKPGLQVV